MDLSLPTGWFSCQIPGRPCHGTYCLFPLEALPPLPEKELHGPFDWLSDPGRRLEWAIGSPEPGREFRPASLGELATTAAELGLQLPAPFETFLGSERRNRIRSATGCWLELPQRLVILPGTTAYAVRFLNDQQGVLFWYVVLGATGDMGVVVSNDLIDATEPWLDDQVDTETYLCAPSFEAFLYRFWLENEIYFRTDEGAPLSPAQQRYLEWLGSR